MRPTVPTSFSTGWRSEAWPRSSRPSAAGSIREDRGRQADPAPPLGQPGVRGHVRERGQDGGRPHPPEHRPDLRPRPDRDQLLHRHGVRPRPRPAHDPAASPGPRPAHAPRPRAAHREPRVLGPRVRAPQEGRARTSHGDRPSGREPAEHPDLVRRGREAHRLRDREGGHQGLDHRPRGPAGQAPLHEPRAGLGPAHGPPERPLFPGARALRDDHRPEALPGAGVRTR